MIYALFHGFIVTANPDGTIPLNARIVCRIPTDSKDVDHDLVMELIAQANANAGAQ